MQCNIDRSSLQVALQTLSHSLSRRRKPFEAIPSGSRLFKFRPAKLTIHQFTRDPYVARPLTLPIRGAKPREIFNTGGAARALRQPQSSPQQMNIGGETSMLNSIRLLLALTAAAVSLCSAADVSLPRRLLADTSTGPLGYLHRRPRPLQL